MLLFAQIVERASTETQQHTLLETLEKAARCVVIGSAVAFVGTFAVEAMLMPQDTNQVEALDVGGIGEAVFASSFVLGLSAAAVYAYTHARRMSHTPPR